MLHRIYIKSNKSIATLWPVQHANMQICMATPLVTQIKNKRKEARLHGTVNLDYQLCRY